MALVLAKTYTALKAAGVPDEHAETVAEELVDFQTQFASLRDAIGGLRVEIGEKLGSVRADIAQFRSETEEALGSMRADIARMRGGFGVLLWAVGINAAATIAILGVLLQR